MKIGKYYHYVIMGISVISQRIKKVEFAVICMPDVKIGVEIILGHHITRMHMLA